MLFSEHMFASSGQYKHHWDLPSTWFKHLKPLWSLGIPSCHAVHLQHVHLCQCLGEEVCVCMGGVDFAIQVSANTLCLPLQSQWISVLCPSVTPASPAPARTMGRAAVTLWSFTSALALLVSRYDSRLTTWGARNCSPSFVVLYLLCCEKLILQALGSKVP